MTGIVTLSADHAKADEARALAGATVAPDARPLVSFRRPVRHALGCSPGKMRWFGIGCSPLGHVLGITCLRCLKNGQWSHLPAAGGHGIPGASGTVRLSACLVHGPVAERAPAAESGSALVGRVNLVKQGRYRLGEMGVAGSLHEQAGERLRAKLAVLHGEAAQIVHSLRDAKAEPDRQRLSRAT